MTAIAAPLRRADAPTAGAAFTTRLLCCCALALFAAMHWAGIVRPAGKSELFGMFMVALGCGLLLPTAAEVRGRVRGPLAVAGLGLITLLLILLCAHVPTW